MLRAMIQKRRNSCMEYIEDGSTMLLCRTVSARASVSKSSKSFFF